MGARKRSTKQPKLALNRQTVKDLNPKRARGVKGGVKATLAAATCAAESRPGAAGGTTLTAGNTCAMQQCVVIH